VYWREANADGTVQCVAWRVRKGSLVLTRPDGGHVSYGLALLIDRYSGLAEVQLTGPNWDGPDGTGGLGSFESKRITEVTAEAATVGGVRWFFRKDACDAARGSPGR
jgi:hypothetical protein